MPSIIKKLVPGRTLYRVFGLGGQSFIEKHKLISLPYTWVSKYGSGSYLLIKSMRIAHGRKYEDEFSLKDAGIIKNSYNKHRTFLTKKAAIKYMNKQRNKK